jgi:hypothetical protein
MLHTVLTVSIQQQWWQLCYVVQHQQYKGFVIYLHITNVDLLNPKRMDAYGDDEAAGGSTQCR